MKPFFSCEVHGQYREYLEQVNEKKNWILLWTSIAILPVTFLLQALGISLGWLYLFMGVLIGSAVVPLSLCLYWDSLSTAAMIAAPFSGTTLGFAALCAVASTYEGGLSNFLTNTGQEMSMVAGNLTSLLVGGLVCLVVSLIESSQRPITQGSDEIWASTMDIDNPLKPWTEMYKRELNLTETSKLDARPPTSALDKAFKVTRRTAVWGSFSLTFLFIVVWPGVAAAIGIFNKGLFTIWIIVAIAWAVIVGVFVIVTPFYTEVKNTVATFRANKAAVAPVELALNDADF